MADLLSEVFDFINHMVLIGVRFGYHMVLKQFVIGNEPFAFYLFAVELALIDPPLGGLW